MNNPPPISVLGKEKALALCAEFGGSSIYIPKQETLNRELRNKEIIEEYKNGVSLHQLRKKYKYFYLCILDAYL